MPETRQKVKTIVKRYRNMLEKLGIRTERVILFGSHVNGKAHRDSDIDLIIISEDFEKMNLRERIEVLGIAAARIMKPIEAKGYTAQEIKKVSPLSFVSDVLKAGVSI